MTEPALGTTRVAQICIMVSDIETKVRAWSEILGLPMPQIVETDHWDETQAEYMGKPMSARAKLAFFHMENIEIELTEPIGEPSAWQDQLDQHGDSLHHIAFKIKGMKDKLAYLNAHQIPLLQRGEYKGGRYAFANGVARLGTVIELLEND